MGLYKRGNIWWMSFTHEGKQYRNSTETTNFDKATRIFEGIRKELTEDKIQKLKYERKALTAIFYDRKNKQEVTNKELYMYTYSKTIPVPGYTDIGQIIEKDIPGLAYGGGIYTCDYPDLIFLRFEE